MNKNTHKWFALLLSLAMVMTSLPFNLVFADDTAAEDGSTTRIPVTHNYA